MSDLCEADLSRRAFLGTAGALFAWSFAPSFAHAAGGRDPRFICVVLRGALDGLSAVAPLADPRYAGLRDQIALTADGSHPALPLDGFFALHPAMPNLARLFRAKQALVVHAVATGYRSRSHFDGQDVLESGLPSPGRVDSGWLNRVIGALPAGDRVASRGALGVGPVAPLIVRGPAPVLGWAPPRLPRSNTDANAELTARIMSLYRHSDPLLEKTLARALETERMATGEGMEAGLKVGRGDATDLMRQTAEGAARIIAAEDGPRIGALAFDGWDTHANEGGATGRLATLLAGLDAAIAAFEAGLAARWDDTVVMIATEFGRTASVNGTVGTDHGTGTVAFLVGGAVKGGRVLADWPGLGPADLFEGRDLRPTTDLRAVAKGVLSDLFGVSSKALHEVVFPGTMALQPIKGLV